MEERMSSYLLRHIQDLEVEASDPSDPLERELNSIFEKMTHWLLESRLSPTNQVALIRALESFTAQDPEVVAMVFDTHYTKYFLANVPKYVRRTGKLASLVVENVPSDEVRLYVREASRNYVFGHWLSSIALARTALETSLRDSLEESGVTPNWRLRNVIEAAVKQKLLDGPTSELAQTVKDNGDAIIHGKPNSKSKEQKSFDTLWALRGVTPLFVQGSRELNFEERLVRS